MPSTDEPTILNDYPSAQSLPDDLTARRDALGVEELILACKEAKDDTSLIVQLASTVGGLQNDQVRRIACKFRESEIFAIYRFLTYHAGPILLGSSVTPGKAMRDWDQLPKHRDEEQVRLDVNRSFIYYPSSMLDALSAWI